MQSYQQEFIEMAIASEALRFGEFTLKSGRISPYFFNAGQLHKGSNIAAIGRAYAQALVDSGHPIDMIFGPAYKGIPLATATAIALSDHHNLDLPYAYNRKEAKNHGEGGSLVGAPLAGKVAIVDDVITAGTAIREVLGLLEAAQAEPAAIVIGLNRKEKGQGEVSAIDELQQQTGVPVVSIIDLDHIMTYLKMTGEQATLGRIADYREEFGTP